MEIFSRKNILDGAKVVLLSAILIIGVKMVHGNSWTPPTLPPPNCEANTPGCTPPIHVGGGDAQEKTGGLVIGSNMPPENMTLYLPNGALNVGAGTAGTKVDVVGFAKGRGGLCIAGDCRTTWPTPSVQVNILIPSNAVMAFNSDVCPLGWTPYGPAEGRFIFGSGGSISGSGGAEEIVQTLAQLAPHYHGIGGGWFAPSVNQMGQQNCSGNGCNDGPSGYSSANFAPITGTVVAMGSDNPEPMNIMNPYVALLYCKKT